MVLFPPFLTSPVLDFSLQLLHGTAIHMHDMTAVQLLSRTSDWWFELTSCAAMQQHLLLRFFAPQHDGDIAGLQ